MTYRQWLILGILVLCALWRWQTWPLGCQTDELACSNEQGSLTFAAQIVEVERRISKQQLIVRGLERDGRVVVSTGLYPEYRAAQQVEITCRLQSPEAFDGFAYDKYLAMQQIYSTCYRPKIVVTADHTPPLVWLRQQVQQVIERQLPQPSASMITAMLLGVRGDLSLLRQSLSATGTSHIVAVSGMHVAILSSLLLNGLLWVGLWRRQATVAVMLFLVGFVLLVGAPASAVRAATMGGLGLVAPLVGRLNQSSWALVLVAVIMLAHNPLLLVHDVGFQLSFSALWGIQAFGPGIDSWLEKLRINQFIREPLMMTLSAQLTTAPLIIYHFGQFSLIAPLANLLVVPVVPLLLLLSIAAIAVSLLSGLVGLLAFWPVWVISQYIIELTEWLSAVPYAAITQLSMPLWLLFGSYGILLVWRYRKSLLPRSSQSAVSAAG